MNILVPKSERIRSGRIRIGFGSDLHTSNPYHATIKPCLLYSGASCTKDRSYNSVSACRSRSSFVPRLFPLVEPGNEVGQDLHSYLRVGVRGSVSCLTVTSLPISVRNIKRLIYKIYFISNNFTKTNEESKVKFE